MLGNSYHSQRQAQEPEIVSTYKACMDARPVNSDWTSLTRLILRLSAREQELPHRLLLT